MASQAIRILNTLQSGRTVSAAQLKARGITKPTARIRELRLEGHDIRTVSNRRGDGTVYVLR